MASRLSQVLSHLSPSSQDDSNSSKQRHPPWYHPLNPTYFLPRAASIYGPSQAVVHRTAGGRDISRTYTEVSARAAGLAYFLREELGLRKGDRVAIVSPNTPMFLESFYGIAGAGCISLCINYKLTSKGMILETLM
jgi:acyl-CoA synthetase (AMP-forming)/AMP-acid ligase II